VMNLLNAVVQTMHNDAVLWLSIRNNRS